jgi:hypothetical protein
VEGSCEHDIEPLGSIKFWEFLKWRHNWRHFKKGSPPWLSEWVSERVLKNIGNMLVEMLLTSWKMFCNKEIFLSSFPFSLSDWMLLGDCRVWTVMHKAIHSSLFHLRRIFRDPVWWCSCNFHYHWWWKTEYSVVSSYMESIFLEVMFSTHMILFLWSLKSFVTRN